MRAFLLLLIISGSAMAAIDLPRTFRIGSSTDTDVANFATRSGATNISGINSLVVYLKAQGLWPYCILVPCKSSENAGSGSTVYTIGGWAQPNVTLVNSPTWGIDGINFVSASLNYATVTMQGFRGLSDVTVFSRIKPTNASGADAGHGCLVGFGDGGTLGTAWFIGLNTGVLSGEVVACGVTAASGTVVARLGVGTSYSYTAGEDFCETWRTATSSNTFLWKNKVSQSLSISSGPVVDLSPSRSGWTTDDTVNIASTKTNTIMPLYNGKIVAMLFCKIALTNTQRDAITDLINAL